MYEKAGQYYYNPEFTCLIFYLLFIKNIHILCELFYDF